MACRRYTDRLSELPQQDPYSFELGAIFIGGKDEADIERRYNLIREEMPLEVNYTKAA